MALLVGQPGGSLLNRIRGMIDRSRDLAPLAGKVRQIVVDANRERSLRGVDFSGRAYTPLARSTIADRLRHGYPVGPPMNRRGLESSLITGMQVGITLTPSRLQVTKSWSMPWLGKHITGSGGLPQRNPAGFSPSELGEIRAMLPAYVKFGRV